MKTYTIRKIFLLFILMLVITTKIYALPSIREFKAMCDNKNISSSVEKLRNILLNTKKKDVNNWVSTFNDTYTSPIVYAVAVSNLPITEVLIEYAVENNISYYEFTKQDGVSMLTIAAKNENFSLVNLLLTNLHPVILDNAKYCSSILHEVAKNNYINICWLLVTKYNGNKLLHIQDHNKLTPINYLIINRQEKFIVKLLHNFPMEINKSPIDKQDRDYLEYAYRYKMHRLLELLLKQGLHYETEIWSSIRLDVKSSDMEEYNSDNMKKEKNYLLDLLKFITDFIKKYLLCGSMNTQVTNEYTDFIAK